MTETTLSAPALNAPFGGFRRIGDFLVKPKLSDQEFLEQFTAMGAAKMAKKNQMNVRGVQRRRHRLEVKLQKKIGTAHTVHYQPLEHPQRRQLKITDGVVLIGSDAHLLPGTVTTAWRGFVYFVRQFHKTDKLTAVVLNGDVFDFPRISRFPPPGWETQPEIHAELAEGRERLGELVEASPNSRHIHTLGNHDWRFELRLATNAPEFAKVPGVHLKDHFPEWEPCWSFWINDDVVIKHRFKGGTHAGFNNALHSGFSIFTGHYHGLGVYAFSDFRGTRWGGDCGTLAEPYGPQFRDYTEDNPVNWRAGFLVLTFVAGRLQWPEVAYVVRPGVIGFRGEEYEV